MGALPQAFPVPNTLPQPQPHPQLCLLVTPWSQIMTLKHWAVGPVKPARVDVGMGLAAGKAHYCGGGQLGWATKPDP